MPFIDTRDLPIKEPLPGWRGLAISPPNTPHAVKARTPGRAIVVDHPRRAAIGGVAVD